MRINHWTQKIAGHTKFDRLCCNSDSCSTTTEDLQTDISGSVLFHVVEGVKKVFLIQLK